MLVLCLYSKTARLRVGNSPTSSLLALEAFLSPPAQAGMERAEEALFWIVFWHTLTLHIVDWKCEKKVTFSTFSFRCSRMHSATSHYQHVSCDLLGGDVL